MGFCFLYMPFHCLGSRKKASKCKKLIQQVTYRLKFLQARKTAIIAQTREDIAKLLRLGYFQRASILVEQLYKEECRATAYGMIKEICECISNNLPCIAKNSELSVDVKIAVSSVSFAASRCGELPELNKVRILVREWYGNEFEASNVNLLPTNLVKSELKRTLSADPISDDVKLELIKEITKEYSVIRRLPKNWQQVYEVKDKMFYCKEESRFLSDESKQNLPHRVIQDGMKIDLIGEKCEDSTIQTLRFNNHDVHNDTHDKRYEMQQDDEGPRSEKMLEVGYISKTASNLINNLDIWLRKFTKNTQQIQEEDIIHPDDIKDESHEILLIPHQSFGDYEAPVLPPNSDSTRKRTPLCSDIQAYRPLPQKPSRKESNKHMHLKKSTVDDTKTRIQTQTSSKIGQSYNDEMKMDGHVHPKLPYYEDLEATFRRLWARDSR